MSIILLWGCAVPPEKSESGSGIQVLAATRWRPAETEPAPDGVWLEFSSDGRRVTGCSGKNRFFGAVIAEENEGAPDEATSALRQLRFAMLGTTKIVAPTDFENVFYRRLSDTRQFRRSSDGKTLDLLNSRGAILSRWRLDTVLDLPQE